MGLASSKDDAVSVRKRKGAGSPLQKQGVMALIEVAFTHLKCFVHSPGVTQGSSENRNARGC